jgi:hypothetical protein
MSEGEQQTATKKRTRLGVRLAIYALLLVIAAAFCFGMNSIEQWNVSTGQSRTVTIVLGVPVWFGESRSTKVSEWLGAAEGEEAWIRVRGPSIKKAKVSHCVNDLLWQFFHLEGDLENVLGKREEQEGRLLRHHIASAVLQELRISQNICRVSRHFSEFRREFIETFWHDQVTLTSARLEETWNRSGGFINEQLNKPSEPARTQ